MHACTILIVTVTTTCISNLEIVIYKVLYRIIEFIIIDVIATIIINASYTLLLLSPLPLAVLLFILIIITLTMNYPLLKLHSQHPYKHLQPSMSSSGSLSTPALKRCFQI